MRSRLLGGGQPLSNLSNSYPRHVGVGCSCATFTLEILKFEISKFEKKVCHRAPLPTTSSVLGIQTRNIFCLPMGKFNPRICFCVWRGSRTHCLSEIQARNMFLCSPQGPRTRTCSVSGNDPDADDGGPGVKAGVTRCGVSLCSQSIACLVSFFPFSASSPFTKVASNLMSLLQGALTHKYGAMKGGQRACLPSRTCLVSSLPPAIASSAPRAKQSG